MQSGDDSEYGMDASPDKGDLTFLHGRKEAPSERLPRGQHDLSPEFVADHQRTRILDATTHVLSERGYGAMTIGDIVARAHVSRRTFYDHFETKEHCVLATFGAASQCIADAVRQAYVAEKEWDAAMAAALVELMRVLVEYPQTARTCFLEMRSVGAVASQPLGAARQMVSDALRRGIVDRPGGLPNDDIAYELGTGGVLTIIRARLAAGEPDALQRELPKIARALLQPLAGAEAAEAVVARIGEAPADRAIHAI